MRKWVIIGAVIVVILGFALISHFLSPKTKLFQAKVGWIGSDGLDYTRYSFKYFDGEESKVIMIDKPCNLTLNCDVGVKKGKLILELRSPSGKSLWKRAFTESNKSSEKIMLSETGLYRLTIIGESASDGHFNVSWSIQK